jgi:hypothetical protein
MEHIENMAKRWLGNGMRVARERLIFLALSILAGWSERSHKGPVQPDISVRLALALLYALGSADLGIDASMTNFGHC